MVKPLTQFGDIHRGELGDVLVPYLIRQCLSVQTLTVALGALALGEELVGPFLSGGGVVVVHDVTQVFDDTVEGHEVVAGRVYQFFVDAYVLDSTVEHLTECLVRDILNRSLETIVVFLQNGVDLPEDHLVLVFAQWNDTAVVDVDLAVGDHFLQVDLVDDTQSFAVRTGALW